MLEWTYWQMRYRFSFRLRFGICWLRYWPIDWRWRSASFMSREVEFITDALVLAAHASNGLNGT